MRPPALMQEHALRLPQGLYLEKVTVVTASAFEVSPGTTTP